MAFSSEKSIRVSNDSTGDFIYIGPDSDGLGLVEIYRSDRVSHRPETGPMCIEKEERKFYASKVYKMLKQAMKEINNDVKA